MRANDNHIAVVTLFEHARLKTELEPASQSHLDKCDHCRHRLNWMQTAANIGARELTYEPPQSVMDKVLGLGRNVFRLKQLRNFIVATLKFDSFSEPAPAGVRGKDAAARQMTYEADDVEIGLWLRRSEDGSLTLTGQVLSKSSGTIKTTPGHVDLIVEGDHIRTSPLSPWGEFSFPDLPQNQYGLQVSFLDRVLRVPSLPIINEGRR